MVIGTVTNRVAPPAASPNPTPVPNLPPAGGGEGGIHKGGTGGLGEIRVKPLAELLPAPYNPRTINLAELEGLRASLDRFGLVEPIVWNEQTGHVVGGHQRVKALEMSGVTEAQVVVVNMPESEERILNVTLNNPAIQGEFTPGVLPMLDEIEELDPEGFEELRLGEIAEDMRVTADMFDPTDQNGVRLDQKTPIICPACGHEFTR